MKKYIVAIEETIVQEFELAADNADEALNVAKEKYRNGEFVLDAGKFSLSRCPLYFLKIRQQNGLSFNISL